MIFQIDLNLLERIHDAALSDLVSAIMDGRHYINGLSIRISYNYTKKIADLVTCTSYFQE